jgi:sugar lactone lactonase YvrE
MELKTTVLVANLSFPESPRWHNGKLWLTDLFLNRVMHADLSGNIQTVLEMTDTPSGLAWTPNGDLLIVSAMERRLLRLESDQLVEVADLAGLVEYPNNDIVVDGQGRAYIGNMGFDFGNPAVSPALAPLLFVTPDGKARIVAEGLAFPNGIVITPNGQTLIVAESHAARLTAFNIETDGSLSNRRVWAQFPDDGSYGTSTGQITPDGMCLDAEGAVWVASPNTREVLRVKEGAEVAQRIPLDSVPLACMLGGADRRTLFIATTASLNPTDDTPGGRIETLPVEVAGVGLP